jgi:signal transduction histidine kinase
MKSPLILLLLGILIAGALAFKVREKKRPETPIERIRGGIEDAMSELESRIEDLRERAKRVSGEARKKLQDQAHELETRLRALRGQLDDLRTEAKQLLDRDRES